MQIVNRLKPNTTADFVIRLKPNTTADFVIRLKPNTTADFITRLKPNTTGVGIPYTLTIQALLFIDRYYCRENNP